MMNRQYYYLISILPSLLFEKKAPVDSIQFRQLCADHLNRKDLEAFKGIINGESQDKPLHSFYDEWNIWDRGLKRELAIMRASQISKRDKGLIPPLPQIDNEHHGLINRIMEAKNPLDAEVVLAKARWNHLDKMEFGHYFDFEKIISYALKLKIMERLESFDQIKGGQIFKGLLESIEPDSKAFSA